MQNQCRNDDVEETQRNIDDVFVLGIQNKIKTVP